MSESIPRRHRAALRRLGWGPLLWAVCAAGVPAPFAFGQGAAPKPAPLDEIVVTGTAVPRPASEIGATITVIDRERIEKSHARDVLEVLRGVPGFLIVRTGSRGGTTSVFARGGTAQHNLVLLDGVQLNRSGGAFDFSTLSTDGVERIEIVRGPLSALYGSDAVASVIHVITRRGEGTPRGELRALAGSDHTHELAASLTGGSDELGYSLHAGRYATDGLHSFNGESDNSSFRARLDLRPNDAFDLKLNASYTDSEFHFPTDFVPGVPGGFAPVDPDQGSKQREWVAGLDLGHALSPQLEQRLALRWTDAWTYRFDDFDEPRPGAPRFDFSDSRGTNREGRLGAEYRLHWSAAPSDALKTSAVLGLEYERESFADSSQSTDFDVQSGALGRRGPRTSSDAVRGNRALFLHGDLAILERAFLTLGARLDDNDEFGSVLNPLASLAWELPGAGTRLHASASRGFKEPTFSERRGFPAFRVGANPTLEPERSRSLELGLSQPLLGDAAQLSLTWFRTDFQDLIAFVSRQVPIDPPPDDPSAPTVRFESDLRNVRATRSQGLEAELSWTVDERVRIGATYALLRTRVRDAGGLQSVSFREGQALLRQPDHSGSLWIQYTGERLELRLGATFVGNRLDRDDGVFPVALIRNGSYTRVDLALAYRLLGRERQRGTRLLLRLENALDEEYQEAYGFESPGLQWFAGIEQKF